MAREVVTRSADETRALGREVGATLRPGAVLLLDGELGAGKTTFAKGVAEACGVEATVRSPTFALMHRYRGSPDVVHLDLFREKEPTSLDDLGLEEDDAVVVVEWPANLADGVWSHALRIRFETLDETTRRITLP